jgi:two-component system LytT family response regulator
MTNVLIIDDEPLARLLIANFLAQKEDYAIIGEASNGFEALKLIQQLKPDLIFLDIQMPKLTGFELLELLPEAPAVIFTTDFDEFALKAFEVHALDYLLKPFSEERFHAALLQWEQKGKLNYVQQGISTIEEQHRIVIKDGTEIKIIPLGHVQYIEAYDDYVKINTEQKCHLKKQTMHQLALTLPSTFVRIHRSFIVNTNELVKIESFEKNSYIAILKSGKRLPISRNSYSALKQKLGV